MAKERWRLYTQPVTLHALLDGLRAERYSGTLTLHWKDGEPIDYERRFRLETAEVSPASRISQLVSPETANVSPVPSGAGNGRPHQR